MEVDTAPQIAGPPSINSASMANGVPTKPPVQLYRKIWEASKLIQSVPKDKENKHHGFWYSSHDAITKACKDAMDEVGLIWLPMSLTYREERTKIACDIDFLLIDADSGESISILWTGWGMDTQDKALYKAETQCKKTFLLMLFRIPTGELDVDGDSDHNPTRQGQSNGQQSRGNQGGQQGGYQQQRNHPQQSQRNQGGQRDQGQQRQPQREERAPQQRQPERQQRAPEQQQLREDQPQRQREEQKPADKPKEQPRQQNASPPPQNDEKGQMFKQIEPERQEKAKEIILQRSVQIFGKDSKAFVAWAKDLDIVPVDHQTNKIALDMSTAAQVMKLVGALNEKAKGLPAVHPSLNQEEAKEVRGNESTGDHDEDDGRNDVPPYSDDDAPPEQEDEPPYDDDNPPPLSGPQNKAELVKLVKGKNVKLSSAINAGRVTFSPSTIFINIEPKWAYDLILNKADLIKELTSLKLEVSGPKE